MGSICGGCRRENREGRKFCAECGAPLTGPACPSCGVTNEPGENFCGKCGAPLAKPRARQWGAPQELPAPDHLVERILRDRSALEGERKQVTVLFADVKGSMDLASGLDPEEWAGIMQRFFTVLSHGVHRFEGTVDKFTGDGIMALFGAPVAHEDHARRACRAALYLAESISAYADELRRTKGLNFHVRLGLNSGEVVVGSIGDDLRMEYTAHGHTVGLAQRMEALAEPGTVYLTEHAARLVSGYFRLRDLGRFDIKGMKERVRVFALEGTALRRPHEVASWRGLSPLVGRAEEMAALETALAHVQEGDAHVVGVVGEAGVGKSRLCEEFCAACTARGITVRRTAGASHGRAVPLLPILDLLRDYFEITEADSAPEAREKVARRLLPLDAALEEALPLLFDFLGIPDPERLAPRLGADPRMRRIFEILRRVIRRRSERETIVLLLEDLHWFDPQSEAFLEQLIPSYPGTRTLVLANFRPEFHAPWMGHSYYHQVPLRPLPPDAVRELVAQLLGLDLSLASLTDHVMERTGGNPFFVEEVVRALIEDGTLEGEPCAYRLTRRLEDIQVPPTVQAVLAARIDRLPFPEKEVLQIASVIGRTFPEAVLRLVARRVDDDLIAHLRALCIAEFLQEEAVSLGSDYRFWHPLTQEVAYHSLLAERRCRLHSAVAHAIVEVDVERLDERAALVASHFERAGDHLEAARWNARAAAWLQRSNLAEGVRRWRATVAHLAHAPESEETLALGAWARARLLQFGSRTGISDEEAEQLFTEGRTLAERLADPEPLIAVRRFYTTVQIMRGEVALALAGAREVARLGDETGDRELRSALWTGPAIFGTYAGPLDDALRAADTVLALCEGDAGRGARHLGYSPMGSGLLSRAQVLAQMGRLAEALPLLDRTVLLTRQRADVEWLGWALSTYAHLAEWTGEDHEAPARAAEAVRIGEESGSVAFHVIALHALGIAQLGAGEWSDAIATLGHALTEARAHGAGRFEEAGLLAHLARAHLGHGDADAARARADEAVTVARRQGARVIECLALLTRGYVLRSTDADSDAVQADLDVALGLARATGAITYEPFIREELGRLNTNENDLREALQLYSAAGASGHARRLEAELGGLPTSTPTLGRGR